MEKKTNKFYWAPRILSIIFIGFLMLFSLDIFEMNLGFRETIIGLFIHNIPALILLAITVISWKYEIAGAIAFILFGLFYIFRIAVSSALDSEISWSTALAWSLTIAGPALLTGILFLACWFKKRKNRISSPPPINPGI